MPKRLGLMLAALLFAATGAYGTVIGGHGPAVAAFIADAPGATAVALGFRVAEITVEGRQSLSDSEILGALRIGPSTALPFFDVAEARARIKANPIVSEVTVRKLYPDKLVVALVEREPFAVWQSKGKLSVIAHDGLPIDDVRDGRFAHLPLVVGDGANTAAPEFLAILAKFPQLRERIYAAVRVGERRWNLRLKNGVDVKLPEDGVESALARLVAADARDKLFDRDITEVDLRIEGAATVRLSAAAAQAEAEARKQAKKGGTT